MKFLVMSILFAVAFIGCCYEVDCQKENLSFGVVSFAPTDYDTIIFRKYEANSNFQTLLDTIELRDIYLLNPNISGDTVVFLTSDYPLLNVKFNLEAGNDYEIFFPAINKLTRVTEILETNVKVKKCPPSDGPSGCFNSIIGFKIDGQLNFKEPFFINK